MTLRLKASLVAVALFAAGGVASASDHMTAEYASFTAERPYAEVRQDLEDAIINRGYKIDYVGYIGDMLSRTAADVGATKEIYANAEFMQFCSAVTSRKAMEADPANIAFCPYVLFVYETADMPGKVTVGHRTMGHGGSDASQAALAEVDALLTEIAKEAAGGM